MKGYIICNETISTDSVRNPELEPQSFFYTQDSHFSTYDGIRRFSTLEEAQEKLAELVLEHPNEEFSVILADRAPWLW